MSIDPEFEKSYMPSSWSKRAGSEEILLHFVQSGKKITNKVRSSLSCELDIPYGAAERAKYDVYGSNLPNDVPIFVFIHGGYWQELSKEEAGFHVENLVSNGIKVINIGYSLCPKVTVSEIVSQIKCAVEKILKQARDVGSKCVWICGHSVGAHMAASLLHDLEFLDSIKRNGCFKLIKGLILMAGIYDVEPLTKTSLNESLKLTTDEIQNLSLRSLDTAGYEPIRDMKIIVTVGECDAPKFVRESKLYAQKLIGFVDNVEFMLLRNNIDHFDLLENLADSNYSLTRMIVREVNGC